MVGRRRLLVALGICAALIGPGAYLVYQQRPEWLVAAHLISVKDSPQRRAYEAEVAALKGRAEKLRLEGLPEENIARMLYEERRAIGTKYKNMASEPLRRRIYDINAQRYGDPLGPSFESLVRKHSQNGRTDWAAIIDGAARTNPDVDRLVRDF